MNEELKQGKKRTVLVTGAGGFIGGHLCKRYRDEYLWDVVGVDKKPLMSWWQKSASDCHALCDLRDKGMLSWAMGRRRHWDAVVNLACDMGGIGFIDSHQLDCIRSVRVSMGVCEAAVGMSDRYFYSSSACVYPDKGTYLLREDDAWPAQPDHLYGLEKLFSEEHAREVGRVNNGKAGPGLIVRIARFHNIFGPHGSYNDGREKFPAACCRKVRDALKTGKDCVELWGDGSQTRSYLYIEDCLDGIDSVLWGTNDQMDNRPLNIGSQRMVSCRDVLYTVCRIAGINEGYELEIKSVPGPLGVSGRGSDNTLVTALSGWRERVPLEVGLKDTYEWICEQP